MSVALQERGVFSATEWADALGVAIAADPDAPYYECWLAALEALLDGKGLAGRSTLAPVPRRLVPCRRPHPARRPDRAHPRRLPSRSAGREATGATRSDDGMTAGWIDLEGAFNVRDLGGLAVAGGGSTRAGVLLRSDALDQLSAADVDRLVGDGRAGPRRRPALGR